MQVVRNELLSAIFFADGDETWGICDKGEEDAEVGPGNKWRPPAWRKATDEELARFQKPRMGERMSKGNQPAVLELTPDPLEGVAVEQLLCRAVEPGYECRNGALLRFEPCGPPAEWAGGPAPPTYMAMWSDE